MLLGFAAARFPASSVCLASVQTSVWPRRPFAVVAAAAAYVQAPAPAVPNSVDRMVKKVTAIWFRKVILPL